ncbi:MAG TPA: uroporphyrinogen decarboxylase family protein [Planctomycetota bacterium]|nr:uroporphyrinogen decarboxylase family protein [Planctomycetota bacterium]
MLLDVSQYEADRLARWRRLKAAQEFREGDRVPVTFAIGPSYYAWLFDYPIHEMYANPELQVEVQLRGVEWQYEFLRADSSTPTSIGYNEGPVAEAIVFDADVEYPEDTSPRIVHKFETLEEVLAFEVPHPRDNPRIAQHFKLYERFNAAARKMGVKLALNDKPRVGVHPPLSCLCALMDNVTVYAAMYESPGLLKRALDRMFDAWVLYFEYFRDLYGQPTRGFGIGLCDDNISQISGASFREFERPYYRRLIERYAPTSFGLHTDGPNDQHFRILADEVGITSMDIGGFSSLDAAVRDMKGKVFISGGLNCKDFYAKGAMSDDTRRKALAAMKLAAPGGGFELAIGGETYVGVDPQGIRDLVRLVEERGKYPIDIAADEVGWAV